MKTVTPKQLNASYMILFPGENHDNEDCERIMGNWLARYEADPPAHLAACMSWKGKASRALFHALNLPWPKTKRDMIVALI